MKETRRALLFSRLLECFFLLSALLLAGCTVTQQIHLKSDGSGDSQVFIKLHPFVVRYIQDLQESLSGSNAVAEPLIYDLPTIQAAFDVRPGIHLAQLLSPRADELSIELTFDNANELAADPEADREEPLLTFRNTDGLNIFRIEFSRSNFHIIAGLFSVQNEMLSVFVPSTEEDFFTEMEYLELFDYAFEDYAEDQSAREVFENAMISVTVYVDGPIVSQTGGAENGQAVIFEIPILKLVTLENNLVYEVQWK